MQPAFFISPKKSKVIWGIGPQLLLPTATKTGVLGQGKLGLGPTAVVLVQPGKWTAGALINNVWSVARHSDLPDVNQFLLQYFINYNLQKALITSAVAPPATVAAASSSLGPAGRGRSRRGTRRLGNSVRE